MQQENSTISQVAVNLDSSLSSVSDPWNLFSVSLVEAGKVLGIEVLDHIIIGDKEHFSSKDRGMI